MKSLSRFLNIDGSEEKKILLLLSLGFFIGVFNVTFLVHSSSAFLNIFDEKADLPIAIICQGIVGVIFAWIFSFIQNRTSFINLSFGVFLVILLIVIALRLGFEYDSVVKGIAFFSFVLIAPLNAITMLIFWGMVGRLFSIKQTKKLIGSIDSGQLIGTIITSFSIPLVLKFMFESVNLLVIGSLSLIISMGIFLLVSRKYSKEVQKISIEEWRKEETKFSQLFKKKYMLIMASFIVISMIASVFVDYSFLRVTARNYPDARDLAIFIARFEGTILIFSFLVQTFVTDRLIAMYGIRVTIFVTPIIVLILTIVSILVGFSLEYGDLTQSFIYFFLAIALVKLFNTALRDAIDGPAFKLYILPIDSSIRFDVQSKMEGVIKLFAWCIGGLILLGIESTNVFSVTHVSFFLVLIIAVWIYVASSMNNKYKETLQETLETTNNRTGKIYKSEYAIGHLLQRKLEDCSPENALHILNLIQKIQPVLLESAVKLIKDNEQRVSAKLQNQLKVFMHDEHQQLLENQSEKGSLLNGKGPLTEEIKHLSKSKSPDERRRAALLIKNSQNPDLLSVLIELLKDSDSNVVLSAIDGAKHFQSQEVVTILIELLNFPEFSNKITGILIGWGYDIINALETAFHKTGQKENVQYKIIYIYGQIGSDIAIEKLWQKIDYPDIEMYTLILRTFHHLKVRADENQVNVVRDLVEKEIRKAAWNISALEEIDDEETGHYLRQAIEEEIANNYDVIYILLSLIYDEQSIQLVRDNIESDTSEGRVFALELLEIFIAKDLKELLFPLLDDVPAAEKIANLQVNFPRETFDSVEILKQIINRDYNYISRWTKACALYTYAVTPEAAIGDELIANFFNPDALIRETAAWAVVKKDKAVFSHILTRIVNQKRNKDTDFLDNLYSFKNGSDTSRILRIEKVVFLKSIPMFSEIPGVVLSELAELLEILEIGENKSVSQVNGLEAPVYFVFNGELAIFSQNIKIKEAGERDVIDLTLNKFTILANTHTTLFTVDRVLLYDFMIKHYQVTESFINNFEENNKVMLSTGDS